MSKKEKMLRNYIFLEYYAAIKHYHVYKEFNGNGI